MVYVPVGREEKSIFTGDDEDIYSVELKVSECTGIRMSIISTSPTKFSVSIVRIPESYSAINKVLESDKPVGSSVLPVEGVRIIFSPPSFPANITVPCRKGNSNIMSK